MARVAAGQPLVGLDTGPSTPAGPRRRASRATPSPSRRAATWGRRPWRDSSSGAGPTASSGGCGCRIPPPPPAGRCGPVGARWAASPASRRPPDLGVIGLARAPARGGAGRRGRGRGGRRGRSRGRASVRPVSDPVASALLGPGGAAALGEAVRTLADAGMDPEPATLRVAGWTESDWAFRFQLPEDEPPGGECTCPTTAARRSSARPGRGPDPLAPGGVPPP